MKVLKEELITDAEAREILENREKEGEMGYEQKLALEHLRKFCQSDAKKIKELKEELKKIKKLRNDQVIQICNILPKDKDELRLILRKDFSLLTEDEISLILSSVEKAL